MSIARPRSSRGRGRLGGPGRRSLVGTLATAPLFGVLGGPPAAGAPPPDASAEPPAPVHPAVFAAPPPGAERWRAACSTRDRLCLHVPPSMPAATAAAILAAAERSWEALTETLGFPPPEGLEVEPWRIYVVDLAEEGGDAQPLGRDALSTYDRAPSFGRVDGRAAPGCALDTAVARSVARGALLRAAPALDEASARAQAESLARLVEPCSAGQPGDRAQFQRSPERSLTDARSAAFDRGASLFFDWLDRRWAARPGALVVGLSALSPTRTPDAVWREGAWAELPTYFDVLRVSTRDVLWRGSTLEDVLVAFDVDRATTPDAPPPAYAWRVPWPSRPRRFASPEPVAPTGASFVLVDHAGAPPGARLRVEATWEDYARMRWTVVKLDPTGAPLATLPVVSTDRATAASIAVEGLDSVDRVVVVAAALGDTEHPFDPNQGEWEPHGWLLTLAAE